jgi:GNAT superfamily N-acetyltransferase
LVTIVQVEITIRKARREDASAIALIARQVGWYERINQEPPAETLRQVSERLDQCLREGTHTVLVAESAEGVVSGYTSVHWFPHLAHGIDGYVSELFLLPTMTGLGVGGRLLEAIKEQAVTRKCTRLLLMNRRIRESYNRSFYAKHGWEELRDAAMFAFSLALPQEQIVQQEELLDDKSSSVG